MVRLDRIYTRTGDDGQTSLVDGTRVSKRDPRIVANGSIDELNSHLGLARAVASDSALQPLLLQLQQYLFDLGADVSCPWAGAVSDERVPRISQQHVTWLESELDQANQPLQPLGSFVLPGGTHPAAALHVARAVCRRAERDMLELQAHHPINPQLPVFLNRLSDLLFVLARVANDHGRSDVLWQPGSAGS